MQNTRYSLGPKFFGTTTKKSWFDEGDRCAPGPGAHQIKLAGANSPPQWTVGKDTDRNAFLDRHPVPNPSPDRYKITDLNKTHTMQPKFTIPVYEQQQNPNKIDEGNSLDYKPKYNLPKQKYPEFSFGYVFERDYSSAVPSPTTYNGKKAGKKDFNRTQRAFSTGNRPPPYGQEGKYPFPGKYHIGNEIGEGPRYTVGFSDRPEYTQGASPGKFYELSGNMLHTGKGKTMGLLIEVPRNKDDADFPSPIKYNPTLPTTTKNIINYRSSRVEINDQSLVINPSPSNYDAKLLPKEQTVSFTKQKRASPEPNDDPGVGTYEVEQKLGTTLLGHMALKLKPLTQFVNPSPSAYDPKEDLTKPLSQRPINYYSDRIDFSKSITGTKVGPGVYQTRKKEVLSLGKMGKGPKFDPDRNKNPGPGSYQIPNGIGKLPKYCSGPKKLTTTGFSFIELQRQERITKERSKIIAKKQEEQKMNQLILNSKDSEMAAH